MSATKTVHEAVPRSSAPLRHAELVQILSTSVATGVFGWGAETITRLVGEVFRLRQRVALLKQRVAVDDGVIADLRDRLPTLREAIESDRRDDMAREMQKIRDALHGGGDTLASQSGGPSDDVVHDAYEAVLGVLRECGGFTMFWSGLRDPEEAEARARRALRDVLLGGNAVGRNGS